MKQVCALLIKSKYCVICSRNETKKRPAPEHDCYKNHEGSSKSMESSACVSLLKQMHNEGFTVRRLVGDDNSTFRADTRHSLKGR